jgi:hypothetical protein
MKKLVIFSVLFFTMSAFVTSDADINKQVRAYQIREILDYRIHYGMVNAGEARMEVHPDHYFVNGKVCHKITITGKSTGAFDLVMTIRDTWGTYIDTVSLIPQKDYRDITEAGYRLKENVFFNFTTKKASVLHEYKDGYKETREYAVVANVHDMVSGAYYLRNVDYSKLKIGDTIAMKAFLEDKLYDFKVRYRGKEQLDTKFGKINAIKLVPIMPSNDLFSGGSSIRVWLSDDYNKVPLRIEADMFVGKVAIDLKAYKGLKHTITFI